MTGSRGYNFGAGPSCLPEAVLKDAQQALWNWQDTGMSILEVGHRTPMFMELMAETETLCRQILNIPNDFAVLFFGGAARTQFATIPMNLLAYGQKAAYAVTGTWSDMAFKEAARLMQKQAYMVASSETEGFIKPPVVLNALSPNTKYLYYTPNETITGFSYQPEGELASVPLVADMTSCLFAKPVELNRYGLVFAGAQKNISNAGMTLVIVRRDWLKEQPEGVLPMMSDYRVYDEYKSLYATPPTFNCFLMNCMMKWIIAEGGVEALYAENLKKAGLLYDFLDSHPKFRTYIEGENRSIMNVSFTTGSEATDNVLIQQASQHGFLALRGHRFLGGLRASLYNPMPYEGVVKLVDFLSDVK